MNFLPNIQWLCSSAWLEHQTLNLGVGGSNPLKAIVGFSPRGFPGDDSLSRKSL